MIVVYIVIANEVLKCYGFRFCEFVPGIEVMRLWQIGLLEVAFEGTLLGGISIKIWRRIHDKIRPDIVNDRADKIVKID